MTRLAVCIGDRAGVADLDDELLHVLPTAAVVVHGEHSVPVVADAEQLVLPRLPVLLELLHRRDRLHLQVPVPLLTPQRQLGLRLASLSVHEQDAVALVLGRQQHFLALIPRLHHADALRLSVEVLHRVCTDRSPRLVALEKTELLLFPG